MTQEELQEFLKDEGNKETFDQMAKALGYETPDETKGLKEKNNELIARMKKFRDERDTFKKQLDNIDVEEYTLLKEKVSEKETSSEKLQRELARLQSAVKEKELGYSEYKNRYEKMLIDSNLSSIMDEVGIAPVHKPILQNAFRGKAKLEEDNIIIDNDNLGLPIKEFFQNFANSDTGKIYLKQKENSGTQSRGFNSTSKSVIKRSDWDLMGETARATALKEGATITE
jgi:hypothetical protein